MMKKKEQGKTGSGTSKIDLFGRSFSLPRSRLMRILAGVLLIIGGIFGFLPILGFWMIPLGLLVLSHDSVVLRRWRRKIFVRFGRWRARNDNN